MHQAGAVTKNCIHPARTHDAAKAATPARYALERGAWEKAATLEVLQSSTFLYAERSPGFARGISSTKTGNRIAARAELNQLHELQRIFASKNETAYRAVQADVLNKAASAWIAHEEGHDSEAIPR